MKEITFIQAQKLAIFGDMKALIELVYFSGDVRFRDEAKRLVEYMSTIDAEEETEATR